MPKLAELGKMAFSALTGGWGGFAALALLCVAGLVAFFSVKKWLRGQTRRKNMKHRADEQAKSPLDNRKADDAQAKAEDEIEDIIKGDGP